MRRFGPRDDQWERIKNLLPGREGPVGVTAAEQSEAVLYRYRFSRWAKSGVWERLFQHLAADADNEYAMIDSTIVRAHQHSAGGQKSW
jgi:hypothetical protein